MGQKRQIMKITPSDLRMMIYESIGKLDEWGKHITPKYSYDDPLEYVKDDNVVDGGNFPIKRNGKEYWVSRSNVISLYVFCKDETGRWCVLASKRGPKVKVSPNKWNVVCGFLDYGYTLEDTAVKECFEETGVKINKNQLRNNGTFSHRKYDAVSTRFSCVLSGTTSQYPTNIGNCEPGEVTEAKWIPLDEIGQYIWMSNQGAKILDAKDKILGNEDFNDNQYFSELLKNLQALLNGGFIGQEKYNTIINILKS